MDKEQIKRALEKKLKELGAPQEDIDKALLDYDTLANDINDPKVLERFGEQLIENVSYKNNIAPDDGLEEYRKLFPENFGVEPPSDKDIEDFLNEEIKKEIDDNQKTSNADSVEDAVDNSWPPEDPWGTGEGPMEDDTNKRFGQDAPDAEDLKYQASNEEFDKIIADYEQGNLTDEEIAELRSQNQTLSQKIDNYDQSVANAGQQFGVKDNALWSNMVKAGARLLGAIDEEIIYSPLIMAQKGMSALGIPGAGLVGTGLSGVLAYESILFKGMVGMAVLAHGTEMLKGEVERAPENLELIKENTVPAISNAILGLFGMGMPEQLTQSHQKDLKPKSEEYEASVAEQGENHKNMLYNQAYLYSRVSPSLRFYTDVLGPKFGVYDQIAGIKKVAGMGKKTGETRSYNQFGVND